MNIDNNQLRQYIENTADLMEEHGLPRMAGRVIGALMICTPPYLSHDELAEQLQASKGSISMTTQLLTRVGILERISLPGHRKHHYQLRSRLWQDLLSTSSEHIQQHRRLADDGLHLLKDEPAEAKLRLIELQVFSDFILELLPEMADRWERRRPELMEERLAQLA
ncbi:MarR family transcriptional regulator [Candidatus Bipolaricaulota bacterium]|nr:MarR family transcriptional regulator [Candidatus Bipolaricaulota bacterium]TFH10640.1 MAG: MarR family transcriptional regulator [Candidatus Atribacteria bacterium]